MIAARADRFDSSRSRRPYCRTMKHYFASQLISKVEVTEENEQRIVFRGHYQHGDGGSVPALLFIPALICGVLIGLAGDVVVQGLLFALAGASAFGALWVLSFEKIITFDLVARNVVIRTKSLRGTRSEEFPVADLRLHVENIAIRLAQDCGAMDLLLPDDTAIRLSVDGRYGWSQKKAHALHAKAGVPLR